MFNVFPLSLIFVFFLIVPISVSAQEDGQPATGSFPTTLEDLTTCSCGSFKITFLCDPKWDTHADDNIVVYMISFLPAVSISIIKISRKIKFLEQVNKKDLALTDRYAPGFTLQDDILKGKKVKKVMGYSKASPGTRYLDYYILNNDTLYSILFAVDPPDAWDSYKFLIKTITNSIEFH